MGLSIRGNIEKSEIYFYKLIFKYGLAIIEIENKKSKIETRKQKYRISSNWFYGVISKMKKTENGKKGITSIYSISDKI